MPKWALAVGATVISLLLGITGILLLEIFGQMKTSINGMADEMKKTTELVYLSRQEIAVLKALVETKEKICRLKN